MKTKSHILIACHSPGDVVGGQWQLLAFHFAFSFSKEVALPTPPASGLEKKDHVEVSYYLAHPLPQLNLQFKRSLKIGLPVPFSIFHIYALTYNTCFYLSYLLHSV